MLCETYLPIRLSVFKVKFLSLKFPSDFLQAPFLSSSFHCHYYARQASSYWVWRRRRRSRRMVYYFLYLTNTSPDVREMRLGSYGGEDSPLDISRVNPTRNFPWYSTLNDIQGMYAGEVGTPRLLKLFKKYDIKTTWFIPGEFDLRRGPYHYALELSDKW